MLLRSLGMAGPAIVHIEFKSSDFERTSDFYAKLFDWKTDRNASGSYMKFDGADGPSGGWVRADLVQSPGPIAYLTVDDLAAKLDEVETAGGRVLVRSMPFAGGGEIGLFADPDGNVLGLWQRKAAGGGGPAGAGAAAVPGGAPAGEAAKAVAKVASPKVAKPVVSKPKKKK
jgi:predicted enzyme related to lactoylglutathione lyase